MKNHAESGYFLLSMLVFIMSVGAGWFGVASTVTHYATAPTSISDQDRRGLVNARQSMLSYAALYPYLYGPTGAGPAHLPCPDTDGYRQNEAEQQSAKHQLRDGPNPPCASLTGSDGQLPRHVALPGHRYLFHTQSAQRYEYFVAGSVVNNPLNRMINLDRLHSQAHQPVAIIRLHSSIDAKPAAQVAITGVALARATVASVAAWVVEKSSQVLMEQCLMPQGDVVTAQQTSEAQACISTRETSPQCENDELLVLVLDLPGVLSDDCLENSLELNTIDGVPAKRHWFVRNKWYTSFKLAVRDECNTERQLLSCVLSMSNESMQVAFEHGSPIELRWVRLL